MFATTIFYELLSKHLFIKSSLPTVLILLTRGGYRISCGGGDFLKSYVQGISFARHPHYFCLPLKITNNFFSYQKYFILLLSCIYIINLQRQVIAGRTQPLLRLRRWRRHPPRGLWCSEWGRATPLYLPLLFTKVLIFRNFFLYTCLSDLSPAVLWNKWASKSSDISAFKLKSIKTYLVNILRF